MAENDKNGKPEDPKAYWDDQRASMLKGLDGLISPKSDAEAYGTGEETAGADEGDYGAVKEEGDDETNAYAKARAEEAMHFAELEREKGISAALAQDNQHLERRCKRLYGLCERLGTELERVYDELERMPKESNNNAVLE